MKLITLNCEGKKHLDKIQNFIEQENPSVLCLQEICADDAENIYRINKFASFTFSMNSRNTYSGSDSVAIEGNALFSRYEQTSYETHYYHECVRDSVVDASTHQSHRDTESRNIQIASITGAFEQPVRIANTHFTWSPDGMPSVFQFLDLPMVMKFFDDNMPTLLCGDFNIPRKQNKLYQDILDNGFVDHIPTETITSLDMSLHRCKNDTILVNKLSQYMVDYVFSKHMTDFHPVVKQVFGISDHSAFVLIS